MAPQAPDRDKALDLALAQIDKNFGKGSVMRLGEGVRQPIAVIPTGSIALDVALGIGGLPRGRVIEIYGPESSGKTTVHCTQLPMLRPTAASRRSSMRSTHSIPTMQPSWASIPMHSWSHSRTRVSRPSKSPTC